MSELRRELQETEVPVILDAVSLGEYRTRFRFAFEGRAYDVTGPTMSPDEFREWLPDYASKTPRCACCEKVILPGQAVTVGHIDPQDSGHSHFPDCNDTTAGFAGSFDSEGVLGFAEAA